MTTASTTFTCRGGRHRLRAPAGGAGLFTPWRTPTWLERPIEDDAKSAKILQGRLEGATARQIARGYTSVAPWSSHTGRPGPASLHVTVRPGLRR